jgi:hypothetical protein
MFYLQVGHASIGRFDKMCDEHAMMKDLNLVLFGSVYRECN